jgi:hypothetical protein
VHPDGRQGADLAARLRKLCGPCRIVVLPPQREARALAPDDVEVMVVPLGKGVDSVAFAASLLPERPWVHAVFISDGDSYPEAEALRCLGARYLVRDPEVWSWLPAALAALGRHARASRALAEAERAIPPPPRAANAASVLPLASAEQRFREAYLRVVLAGAGSHKAAAQIAGVPYTTLRSMLEKLHI